MKQLLFLLLFPCLALAQYTGNGNQKITLGEQTSADGLVYRGNAADTVAATLKITKTNKSDTSAFLLLDTINNVFLKYNIGTTFWTRLNILPTDTASMLGNYWRSGRFSGVLPVANGGTGKSTLTLNKLMVGNGTDGVSTPTELHWDNANKLLGVNTSTMIATLNVAGVGEGSMVLRDLDGTNTYMSMSHNNGESVWNSRNGTSNGTLAFYSQGTSQFLRLYIDANGNVGIGTPSPAVQLHTTSNVRFAGLTSITDLRTDADGDLYNGSDFNLKNSIDTINFGLSDVLKLKPVSFNWNDEARNINEYKSMGFIAQDVMDVIPNAASTMGDGDMQVDYNAIVATLTKAIQEQNALIKALEQRLLILENK